MEEGNPPLLTPSPCHGQSLLPGFIASLVPVARVPGHLLGESHALGTLRAEETCPWWLSAVRPTQRRPGTGMKNSTKPQSEVKAGSEWWRTAGRDDGQGRGCRDPPAAPHHLPGDWRSAFPTISPLGDAICVSSWDAAGGRPCHGVSHPARLTGNGWCLQRVRCPKALCLWWGSCREQWGGDQGESV